MNRKKLLCGAIAGILHLRFSRQRPASARSGTFKNFDSAATVVSGIAYHGFFVPPNAVNLSSVTCSLSAPPNTTEPDRSSAPPYNVTDSGISFNRIDPFRYPRTKLSAFDFNGSDCGGAPRVEVNFSGGRFITGYFGPRPSSPHG